MKKILFIIVLFIPLFCLGQGKVADENPQSKLEKILKNLKEGEEPLYVIDGIPSENAEILDMDSVADISYLKNERVKMVFGEKAKDGIIIIITNEGVRKKNESQKAKDLSLDMSIPISISLEYISGLINFKEEDNVAKTIEKSIIIPIVDTVYLVDGKIYPKDKISAAEKRNTYLLRKDSLNYIWRNVMVLETLDTFENKSSVNILDKISDNIINHKITTPIHLRESRNWLTLIGPTPPSLVYKEWYEATVLDAGFNSFLATQKSKDYYSIASLKAKNEYLVSEWNYRCSLPLTYNPNIYEQKIDYESRLDYGLDVEYTVYMFFKFIAEENNIRFDTTFI